MDAYLERKIVRKQKHHEDVLLRHENLRTSSDPTNSLYIGNGGLMCGVQRELLLDVFSKFGPIQDIIMMANKPYAFVIYHDVESAQNAVNNINGRKSIHINVAFYLSFISSENVPQKPNITQKWPEGLILLEDFVTEQEEVVLLAAVGINDSADVNILKHRKVKHFGYEFLYGSNNVDKNKKLDAEIPGACISHLEKLVALGYIDRIPDQLTVNHYVPGQGIPPHVDTHSAFEDGIISLSLSSQIVMEFYRDKECVPVYLPRRSALVMSRESRYLWKHGITPRKNDIVPMEDGLTLKCRSHRTSLTFRILRCKECTCRYKEQCDSQKTEMLNEKEACQLESQYVNQVYEDIARPFSETRYKPWPKVVSFLRSLTPGSLVLDIGCGNGKNMGLTQQCFEVGCDASSKLVQVCSERRLETMVANCLKLPFRDNCADAVICIAVIHHMATQKRRLRALKEILRVLHPEGEALIYAWAFEQEGPQGPSQYLDSGTKAEERKTAEIMVDHKRLEMPIHESRTRFLQQDVLVPWKKEADTLRYYHVFAEGELHGLALSCGATILHSYYDGGNWCLQIKKGNQ